MRRVLLGLGGLVAVLLVGAVGFALYVRSSVTSAFDAHVEVPARDVPIPWPLSEVEIAALRAEQDATLAAVALPDGEPSDAAVDPMARVDLDAIARERAVARGEHLFRTRGICAECHGEDLGGHIMIDDFAMGAWVAPDIAPGGVADAFTPTDWVRIIRHGVRHDGRPAHMTAAETYARMYSDREISDLVAYLRTLPPAPPRDLPEPSIGPMRALLLWSGEMPIAAQVIDHDRDFPREPPPEGPTVEFGAHLGVLCAECHHADLLGGTPHAGPPGQKPTPNLTQDETGLAGWTRDDFARAVRAGVRPDGSTIDGEAMPWPWFNGMTDTEIDALWAWTQSLPPGPERLE